MLAYGIAGLIVALAGLSAIEYLGNRYGRNVRFYSMVAIIGISILVRAVLPEDPGVMYIFAWMLGACIYVAIGLGRRSLRKKL